MSKKMNAFDILKDWLATHGYDGLYNASEECGCVLDFLNPCGECSNDCLAGYKIECDGSLDHCDEDKCDWHIGERK